MGKALNELLKEICEENDIKYETFSKGWVTRLTFEGRTRHLIGNHSDANHASADRIACDKCACSILLEAGGVNTVPHMLVFNPTERSGWIDGRGTWSAALEYITLHGRVVVKPNNGWQGNDVYLCESPAELENALSTIFKSEPDACLSPFFEFEFEYRVFFLNGECLYSYGKKRAPGNWKHNLSGGASAFDITDSSLKEKLDIFAKRAADCIGISFAAVDIAVLPGGELMVMEINSGVVAEKLLEQNPERRGTVKNIYTRMVKSMFRPAAGRTSNG